MSINRYDQEEMYGQVLGIGIDQIECDRVLRSCEKKTFLEHCYTTKELEMISRHKRSSATNFCGKEAVVKAFGTGFRKITPNEIRRFFGMNQVHLMFCCMAGQKTKQTRSV